ncbi:GTPase-activating protein GYP1 SCDLUD_003140 [Saccharomycodes ludwigii]|uniref:GTPase-activating protein GYP1 n=1 Tax=Saccharomycodes ludwigii TaxID=36035 RepID=UPI001E87244F|nr:hypothetical protein SCDLUD_003140 [Saccharomycodes ludwigii]KAH3900170.1 hypothetical protein SCDLUD_003140 [Saccharomycodes ludwigii]
MKSWSHSGHSPTRSNSKAYSSSTTDNNNLGYASDTSSNDGTANQLTRKNSSRSGSNSFTNVNDIYRMTKPIMPTNHHHSNNHSSSSSILLNNNNTNTGNINSSTIKKSHHKFSDSNEDWSAVVDDYNMPPSMDFFTDYLSKNSNTNMMLGPSPVLSKKNSGHNNNNNNYTSGSSSSSNNSNNKNSGTITYPKLTEHNYHLELENERELQELNSKLTRINKFDQILSSSSIINLAELKKLSWNGIPMGHRPLVWKLLIGYLPANKKRHEILIQRKRKEYKTGIYHIFSPQHTRDQPTWHQIEIDIPRTNPHIKLYQFPSVQKSLQKILYFWAIRHPASGYVQGINDLVTPFFQIFLTSYLPEHQKAKVCDIDPETYLTEENFAEVEADSFWCLSKFLDTIIDNYIHGQPGIMKQVSNLESLCKRIDGQLYKHLKKENVEFVQFAFRWMNCLLMREVPIDIVIRMWDTYLSETSSDDNDGGVDSAGARKGSGSSNMKMMMNNNNTLSDGTVTPNGVAQNANDLINIPTHANESVNNNNNTNNNSGSNKRKTSLSEFHVFVCAAFLETWSNSLLDMDFQGIITFLQNVPTANWGEKDIEILLSEAYMWQTLYKDATSHWL